MPIIKDNWADALEPGIREWFFIGYDRRMPMGDNFFRTIDSQKSSEHFEGFGAISPDAFDHFKTTGVIPDVDFDAGYKTTLTPSTYMARLKVQREMAEDNLYPTILDRAERLGDAAALKMEKDKASMFNNGFTATAPYLGGDGVALFSNSHPFSASKAGTVQDNNYALTLNATNVDTIRRAMMAFTDDVNELVGVIPNHVLVPPALEDTAKVLFGSENKVGSMDNDINPHFDRFTYSVWHYLTDSNAWFMIDTRLMEMSSIWVNRIPLSIYQENTDTSVFASYLVRWRSAFGWRDWRWVVGSNPS